MDQSSFWMRDYLYIVCFFLHRVEFEKLDSLSPMNRTLMDTENAVMNTFDFLEAEHVDDVEVLRFVFHLFVHDFVDDDSITMRMLCHSTSSHTSSPW